MEERALAAAMGERKVCPKMAVQDVKSACSHRHLHHRHQRSHHLLLLR